MSKFENLESITFNELPSAVAYLIQEVTKLNAQIEAVRFPVTDKHNLIDIAEASRIIKKTKGTVYRLTAGYQIPHYKFSGKLYFYEDELLAWIDGNRRKTIKEIQAEVEEEFRGGIGKRRRY